MNIQTELTRTEFSKVNATKIVAYIGTNAEQFGTVMDAFFNGTYRQTQRAALVLSKCVSQQPTLIQPHLKKVVHRLIDPHCNDAVKRNIVRLLQFIAIPKSLHGKTIDRCFALLKSRTEPIAVKVFSMTVLFNFSKQYPELKNELALLIEEQLPYASVAFASRSKKILTSLKG